MNKEKIRLIISNYTTKTNWRDETDIFVELNIDSLNFVKMLVEFEEEMGKEIPPEFLMQEKWKNVNTIYDNIKYLYNISDKSRNECLIY